MTQLPPQEDFLIFRDEDEIIVHSTTADDSDWKILIVDDEEEVHKATI